MQRKLTGVGFGIGIGMVAMAQTGLAPAVAADFPDTGLALKSALTLAVHAPNHQPAGIRSVPLRLRLSAALDWPARGLSGFPLRAIPAGQSAVVALARQARFWSSQGREDLADEALNKLSRMSSNNMEGLEALAHVRLRLGQPEAVQQVLARMRRLRADAPEIARIEALLRVTGSDRDALRAIRELARANRYQEAAQALTALYPEGLPNDDLTLEYWTLIANRPNGRPQARAGLQQLTRQEPDNLRYRLALAELLTSRAPVDRSALAQIVAMADMPSISKRARAAWRAAMLAIDNSPAGLALIRTYLAHEKNDSAVAARLVQMGTAVEARRKLLADPDYQAQRSGLALLAAGKLDAAQAQLQRAYAARATDIDLLDGLGLLRLRQKRHAESEALYLRAAALDPARRVRWQRMADVARYWGLITRAEVAGEARQFALAEELLRAAQLLDATEPAATLALAALYNAQERRLDAERTYALVLTADPVNASALDGLLRLYLAGDANDKVQQLLARMSVTQRAALMPVVDAARAARLRTQSDTLAAAGDTDQAIMLLEQAAPLAPDDPWLRFDLARLYFKRDAAGDAQRGDALFTVLLQRLPNDPSALYAQALLDDSRDRTLAALTTLERLAPDAREPKIVAMQRRLWLKQQLARATALTASNRNMQALQLLAQTATAIGADPELAPQVAEALADAGDIAAARAVLARLDASPTTGPDWPLRRAEVVARFNDNAALAAAIQAIPAPHGLVPGAAARLAGLQETLLVRQAETLTSADDAIGAMALLEREPAASSPSRRLQLLRADTALALQRTVEAGTGYRQLLQRDPNDRDAGIGLIDVLIADGQPEQARQEIERQIRLRGASSGGITADDAASLASRLLDLKDDPAASILIATALAAAPATPRLLNQAAQIAERENQPEQAIDYLRRSLAVAPDTAANSTYRRLADLLDARSTWVAGAIDLRSRVGTTGKSEYGYAEAPFELRFPWRDGSRVALQGALVRSSAGTLDLADTNSAARFGSVLLCQPLCSLGGVAQNVTGLGLSAAIERGDLRGDLGVTPLGFPIQNIVGGVIKKGDLGSFSYAVDASRRAVTGSVLSYAGARDPRTGALWGGVLANGVRFGLSRDAGGRFGAWSSLGLHRLTGTNVQSNNRMQLMGGGYWRLINEDDRTLTAGTNAMLWRFSNNAGEYTFGHGGYYSPQRFASLSLPVSFSQRTARLSYTLRAALSVSRSATSEGTYYPTRPDLQSQAEALTATSGIDPRYTASTGRGVGRSLAATVEYQVSPSLFAGGRFEIDRSTDYAPNRLMLYFRYNLDRASARPVVFPPEPLIPASQY